MRCMQTKNLHALGDLGQGVTVNRRLRVASGPEGRTPSSGPSLRGVAWSIGTWDAPGDGPCPVERPLWAACSSPLCASTLDAASLRGTQAASTLWETQKARLKRMSAVGGGGGGGCVGRLGRYFWGPTPPSRVRACLRPAPSPRFECALPGYGLDPEASTRPQ